DVIADALHPGHFFAAGLKLTFHNEVAEETSWEIFRGRLLDPAQTRARRRFIAWNVCFEGAAEPLLSVKLDEPAGELHVVRAIQCHVWEAYNAGANVILSRETIKWVRELVGTIRLAEFATPHELREELTCRVFQAVIGTSRLPLTSVEAPL